MIRLEERHRLEKRRTELLAELRRTPNLMRGNVYERLRKCGRASCECERGGQRHTGLQLTVTRFVRQEKLAEVEAMTQAYRALWRIVEELTEVNVKLMRGAQVGGRRRG